MAKMSFSASNKAADNETFPKLKLDQDESARLACYEEPEVGFVHNLRAPKIVQGEVQYKVVNTKNGPDRQMDFEFIGNPICLGDFDTLQDRGIDPKNCPACKAAQDAPDMFAPPKRRFAMHVFQYQTNGTTKPTKNFQGAVKVWAFTDQKFGELIDLMEEAPDGDIRNIDIVVTCENKLFQNFKMIHSNQVKWKESEQTTAQFEDIIAENRAKDLSKFLGRTTRKEWMADDIDKVKGKWRQANGLKDERADDGFASAERNLDAGLANLLDNEPAKPAAPVATSTTSKPASNEGPADFDDILASLDED
jgi:hypothetical protein